MKNGQAGETGIITCVQLIYGNKNRAKYTQLRRKKVLLRAPTEFIMMGHNLSIHLLLVGISVGFEIGRSVGWSIVLFIILHEYLQRTLTYAYTRKSDGD